MRNKISDLKDHLFETIEMLKNNSDPDASDNEKIDIETAKAIGDLGKVIVDAAKTEVQALNIIARHDNDQVRDALKERGIIAIGEGK